MVTWPSSPGSSTRVAVASVQWAVDSHEAFKARALAAMELISGGQLSAERLEKLGFSQNAAECGGKSVDDSLVMLDRQIRRHARNPYLPTAFCSPEVQLGCLELHRRLRGLGCVVGCRLPVLSLSDAPATLLSFADAADGEVARCVHGRSVARPPLPCYVHVTCVPLYMLWRVTHSLFAPPSLAHGSRPGAVHAATHGAGVVGSCDRCLSQPGCDDVADVAAAAAVELAAAAEFGADFGAEDPFYSLGALRPVPHERFVAEFCGVTLPQDSVEPSQGSAEPMDASAGGCAALGSGAPVATDGVNGLQSAMSAARSAAVAAGAEIPGASRCAYGLVMHRSGAVAVMWDDECRPRRKRSPHPKPAACPPGGNAEAKAELDYDLTVATRQGVDVIVTLGLIRDEAIVCQLRGSDEDDETIRRVPLSTLGLEASAFYAAAPLVAAGARNVVAAHIAHAMRRDEYTSSCPLQLRLSQAEFLEPPRLAARLREQSLVASLGRLSFAPLRDVHSLEGADDQWSQLDLPLLQREYAKSRHVVKAVGVLLSDATMMNVFAFAPQSGARRDRLRQLRQRGVDLLHSVREGARLPSLAQLSVDLGEHVWAVMAFYADYAFLRRNADAAQGCISAVQTGQSMAQWVLAEVSSGVSEVACHVRWTARTASVHAYTARGAHQATRYSLAVQYFAQFVNHDLMLIPRSALTPLQLLRRFGRSDSWSDVYSRALVEVTPLVDASNAKLANLAATRWRTLDESATSAAVQVAAWLAGALCAGDERDKLVSPTAAHLATYTTTPAILLRDVEYYIDEVMPAEYSDAHVRGYGGAPKLRADLDDVREGRASALGSVLFQNLKKLRRSLMQTAIRHRSSMTGLVDAGRRRRTAHATRERQVGRHPFAAGRTWTHEELRLSDYVAAAKGVVAPVSAQGKKDLVDAAVVEMARDALQALRGRDLDDADLSGGYEGGYTPPTSGSTDKRNQPHNGAAPGARASWEVGFVAVHYNWYAAPLPHPTSTRVVQCVESRASSVPLAQASAYEVRALDR